MGVETLLERNSFQELLQESSSKALLIKLWKKIYEILQRKIKNVKFFFVTNKILMYFVCIEEIQTEVLEIIVQRLCNSYPIIRNKLSERFYEFLLTNGDEILD